MKKIITIIGARPQFIKACVVSQALKEVNSIQEVILHTGQHYDHNMSSIFFSELAMPQPKYNLNIGGGLHGAATGRMLQGIEEILIDERPDAVLVYGDTNSTLAGALAASKLHIPIAHVEAGLRSKNRLMPEEINRIMVDHIAHWLFAPTHNAMENLNIEGLGGDNTILVGDVMYDAALNYRGQIKTEDFFINEKLFRSKNYLVATIHRAENTDNVENLTAIVSALSKVAENLMPIIWPLHPRTRSALERAKLIQGLHHNIILVDPVGYLEMLQLEINSAAIVTDSGGVQKEAYFASIPCVTLRLETEWGELVDAGWNRLVDPVNSDAIVSAIYGSIQTQGSSISLYGSGTAATSIASKLCRDIN